MAPSDDLADTRMLVQRAQAGDAAALDELLEGAHERLYALVRARLGPGLRCYEESADVVQSVFGAAVRDLPDFEWRGKGSFLRWLGAIVENRIRHHARDLGREKRDPERVVSLDTGSTVLPVAAPQPSPSEVAAGREFEERYQRALADLPDADREILLLHLEVGCSHEDIAAALGIVSPEAVRKRIARALARLQIRLGDTA